MKVMMTESAARQVQVKSGAAGGVGLRLGVKQSGCTGLAYVFDIAREIGETDIVFESFGAKLVIDPLSLPYLQGSQLDYVREGLGRVFKVNNPNVKASCGCGESFSVEEKS
ncbi:iron-sulfur cluster assembly accessory protein [Ferrovum sp.]|uniref:HesB/IscA family protein n=1 Tax=Ferrovum sp. TaxID=2609467 RepID=UPI00262E9F3B|nr:iron-sulfur cluster assembly accessory protein [Ferrovum sp.]